MGTGVAIADKDRITDTKMNLKLEDYDLIDSEELTFGNDDDVSITWDGTNLLIIPVIDDTGAIHIGNGTLSIDVQIFGHAVADYILWDSSESMLSLVNTTLTAGDAYSGLRVNVTAPLANNSYGIAAYFDTTVSGAAAGNMYGVGSWINGAADFTSGIGEIIVPFEGGVYLAAVNATARIVFGGQFQAQLTGVPNTLHVFRINCNQPASGEITAIFAAANPQSIHYAAGESGTGVVGTIPIADVVGTGVVYVEVHGGSV